MGDARHDPIHVPTRKALTVPKTNPDFAISDEPTLVLRNAELTKAMVDAKRRDDPAGLRAAKDELRAFRQHWRQVAAWIAFCNLNDVDPADGTARPDAIAASAKAQEV
jgi:hypothetical protein